MIRRITPRRFALITRTLAVASDYFCAALIAAVPTMLALIAIEYLTRPGTLASTLAGVLS